MTRRKPRARAEYGTGSVYQDAAGRWYASVRTPQGRKKRRARDADDAARILTVMRGAVDDLPAVPDERQTVAEYLDSWLASVRHQVDLRTWSGYESLVRVWCKPHLGDSRLTALRPEQLRTLYGTMMDRGRSPVTVGHVHTVLRLALGQAVAWGELERNVATRVRPPTIPDIERPSLNPEQVRQLFAAARGSRLEALFVLAATTALREGELFALRWQDVDLDGGVLRVARSLSRRDGELRFKPPKSRRSRRTVPLGQVAVDALRRHRERQPGIAEALIFRSARGTPLSCQNVLRREFYPLLERAGLPRVTLHALRHSAASLWLQAGVPLKVVSELLGHSGIGLTSDLYGHLDAGMLSAAAVTMDSVISPGIDPTALTNGSNPDPSPQPDRNVQV